MNGIELWLLVIVRESLVAVPVLFVVPLLISTAPPLVICLEAALALCTQIMPAIDGFAAVLAVFRDSVIEPRFRLLNPMAAMFTVISVNSRSSGQEQERFHSDESGYGVKETPAILIFSQGFLHSN